MTPPDSLPAASTASRRRFLQGTAALAAGIGGARLGAAATAAGQTGEPLPAWREGELEIHHINTGRGDCVFFILPDGTTLLYDAGDLGESSRPEGYIPPARPDGSRPAGEWIGRYIRARHPEGSSAALDYALMSHFHGDHIAGYPDVASLVPVRTLIDRTGPVPEGDPDAAPASYRRFVEEQVAGGMGLERFQAGRSDQIALRKDPARFPGFQVRNLAVNAEAWTGRGLETRPRFADDSLIGTGARYENMMSAAFVLRYGDFAYYIGADLQEPMEEAIAWLAGPVDVHVANHHGSQANPFFLATLKPRIHIVQVWAAIQPRPHVFERFFDESIYPGPREVFLTNGLWPGRAEHFLERYEERVAGLIDGYSVELGREYVEGHMARIAPCQGHVVVRVEPGGGAYRVAVLDDRDESFTVRSIHGPYEAVPKAEIAS